LDRELQNAKMKGIRRESTLSGVKSLGSKSEFGKTISAESPKFFVKSRTSG